MSWFQRQSILKPPAEYKLLVDELYNFSIKECSNSERNNWNDVLKPLPIGSLSRILWAIAFLKSTNGVADKVSCGHFRKLISQSPNLSIESYRQPHRLAALMRQTSKWVKNTFVLVNIFQHIEIQWRGVPSKKFNDWINLHEIGPKTAALLFHAAFEMSEALPVDSHVWCAFRRWKWTNATSRDECSWQATNWMDSSYYLKTNDAIGSIRQALADKKTKDELLSKASFLTPTLFEMIKKLL
jgi:endonuclease III